MASKPYLTLFSFLVLFFLMGRDLSAQPTKKVNTITKVASRAYGDLLKNKPTRAIRRLKRHLKFASDPSVSPIPLIPIRYVPPNRRLRDHPELVLDRVRFLLALALLRNNYKVKIKFYVNEKDFITLSSKKLKDWVKQVLGEYEKKKTPDSISAQAEFQLSLNPDSTIALKALRELSKKEKMTAQSWVVLALAERRLDASRYTSALKECKKRVEKASKRFCKPD